MLRALAYRHAARERAGSCSGKRQQCLAQTYTTLFSFGGGGSPRGTLVEGPDGNLYGTTYGYAAGTMDGLQNQPGGTFTTLHSGGTFQAGLTLGTVGSFYGTSIAGGTYAYSYVLKSPRMAR